MFPNPPKTVEQEEPKVGGAEIDNVPTGIGDRNLSYYNLRLSSHGTDLTVLDSLHERIRDEIRNFSDSPRVLARLGDIYLEKGMPKKAIKPYKNAIKLDPTLIAVYRKLIQAMLALGKVDTADFYFKQLLEITHYHADYELDYQLFRLAHMTQENDAEKVSRDIYKKLVILLKKNQDNDRILTALGVMQLMNNELKKAAMLFDEALKLAPTNIHAINNLGIIAQHSKNFTKARSLYRKALKYDPKYAPGYENLAASYMETKKYKEALNVLEDGEENGIIYSEKWMNNYSWLLFSSGKNEHAEMILRSLLEVDDKSIGVWNNLGATLKVQNKRDEATEAYKKSIQLVLELSNSFRIEDKGLYNAFHNLLSIYTDEGKVSQQKDLAKLLIQIEPDDLEAHYYLGAANVALKKYESVEEHLLKAINGGINKSVPYILLSFYYTSIAKEQTKAISLLEGIDKSLVNEGIRNNLAYAYLKNDEVDKAEAILKQAKIVEPVSYATKGLVAFYKGNLKEGNTLYKKAIDAIENDEKDHVRQVWKYELAIYYTKKGDIDQALNSIQQSLSYDKNFHNYNDALELQGTLKRLKAKI